MLVCSVFIIQVSVPVDLSKLSDAVKTDAVKNAAYGKLVTKVNNIDTSGFVLKTKYDAVKSQLKKIQKLVSLLKNKLQ